MSLFPLPVAQQQLLKYHLMGTSLVVQQLRLHTPNAGARVRSLVTGTRSCMHATTERFPHATTKKILHATTKDPACHN